MTNPETTEKMQIVVDSLKNDPRVVVVGGFERNYLQTGKWPSPNGYWSRTLDIYTHPTEPIYAAGELNDFMLDLVPELEASAVDRFRGGRDSRLNELELGKLYFDESIGSAALSASVRLNEGISVVRQEILDSEWKAEQEIDLRQRTRVRVFPDQGHLTEAALGMNEYRIPNEHLGTRVGKEVIGSLLESPMFGGVIEGRASHTPALNSGSTPAP